MASMVVDGVLLLYLPGASAARQRARALPRGDCGQAGASAVKPIVPALAVGTTQLSIAGRAS